MSPKRNQNATKHLICPLSFADHVNIRTLSRGPQSVSLFAWCCVDNTCYCLCRFWTANYRWYALWSFLLVAYVFRRENGVRGSSCSGQLSIGNIPVKVGDHKYIFLFTTKRSAVGIYSGISTSNSSFRPAFRANNVHYHRIRRSITDSSILTLMLQDGESQLIHRIVIY